MQNQWEAQGHGKVAPGVYVDARSYRPNLNWNYAVKGWLLRNEVSVLYGPSNCGKSAMVCMLGHAIVSGKTFFGSRVTAGTVVHVGSEAPKSILDRMVPYKLEDAQTHLYSVRENSVDLSDPVAVAAFIAEMRALQDQEQVAITLIVFDTLARSIGDADENCNSTMTRVANAAAKIARSLNSHVMLVHHTGKDVERGSRGASALRAAVDTEISLEGAKDSNAVSVTQVKQRAMKKSHSVQFELAEFVLGLDEDDEERTTVQARETADVPEASFENKRRKGSSPVLTAVETFLHLQRSTGHCIPFTAKSLASALPPKLFGDIAPDSRVKSVTRALETLASQPDALVHKRSKNWEFTNSSMQYDA